MDAFFTFFVTKPIADDFETDVPVDADTGGGWGPNNFCTIA